MPQAIETSTKPKPFVFVVMPFAKEFSDVYKLGIKPACVNAGAYCERLDEQVYDEGMLDRIYNQIAKADIVVADMSGQNPNVFYEVGYAHALGKKVVLITKSAKDIPFDLAHRYHLVYGDSIADLGQQLEERIKHYVLRAEKRQLSDVDCLEFYIDGRPLDAHDAFPIEWKYYDKSMVWWVAIAVHNPPGVNVTDVRFGADLIVPDIFSFCLNHEFADIDNIPLPGRKFLHQRLKEDSIPPGGWRQLVFPLIQSDEFPLPEQSEIVLHVLSNGLAREISFVIKNRPPKLIERMTSEIRWEPQSPTGFRLAAQEGAAPPTNPLRIMNRRTSTRFRHGSNGPR